MRVPPALAVLVLLLVTPVNGDGEPCFVGFPASIVAVEPVADQMLLLRWTEVAAAEWYEVMRCDASGGPCALLSLSTTEALSFDDTESGTSNHLWYRIIARTGSPEDLCAHNEFCQLPDGQCAGEGTCGPYCEFCNPKWWDPVCSCSDRVYGNACRSCEFGANIRWYGTCAP
jgi:hypothetical protein